MIPQKKHVQGKWQKNGGKGNQCTETVVSHLHTIRQSTRLGWVAREEMKRKRVEI